jgi:transcription antitermination factor NusG
MSKPIEKYYVIELVGKDSHAYHHTYSTSRDLAVAEAISEQVRLGNPGAVVLNVTELGFEIGDRVRVEDEYEDREPWHDLIGTVSRYEFDGYIVVKFIYEGEEIEEEFHWSELEAA